MNFPTETYLKDFQTDKFSYKDLSKSILDNIVLKMDLPNCFGLYGNWGSGKSTLMSFMMKHLTDNPQDYSGIKTIYFEPWKYEYSDQKDLMFALLNCIKNNSKLQNKALWKTIMVDALVIGSGLLRNFTNLDITTTNEDAKTFENKIFSEHENWIDKIEEFKITFVKIISEVLKEENASKLVIFIDDLDRCLPENTVKLLEGIKNFLSIENTLFVLAIDRRVVSEMIEKKYGLHYGYGDEYLMKIVHYYYDLPKVSSKEIIKDTLTSHNIQLEENQCVYITNFLQKFANEPRFVKYLSYQFCIKTSLSLEAKKILTNDTDKVMLQYLFVATYLLIKFPKLFFGSNFTHHLENVRDAVTATLNPSRSPEYQYKHITELDLAISVEDRKQLEEIIKMPISSTVRRSSEQPSTMNVGELNAALLAIHSV